MSDDLSKGVRYLYKAYDKRSSTWLKADEVLDIVEMIEEYADIICELQSANDFLRLVCTESPSELVH